VGLTGAAGRFSAALGAVIVAVHGPAIIPANGERRLDAAGLQACMSVAPLIPELRARTMQTGHARQQLTAIYNIARTSETPALRQFAEAHTGRIASADDRLLLVMAEQFHAACR
jgi:hypothetical protein